MTLKKSKKTNLVGIDYWREVCRIQNCIDIHQQEFLKRIKGKAKKHNREWKAKITAYEIFNRNQNINLKKLL